MNYMKPELVLIGSASAAIQRFKLYIGDDPTTGFTTQSAYDIDE